MSHKELVSSSFEESSKLNIKKTNNPIQMGQKNSMNASSKKICRCQIRTYKDDDHHYSMRYPYIAIIITRIKKPDHINYWRGCGGSRTFIYFCWECEMV